MIVEKELRKLIHELVKTNTAKIDLAGSNITVNVFDNDSKITLSTPVYFGGNFIPKSVRNSLNKGVPFAKENLKTYLTVDEEHFQVVLNYFGGLSHLNKRMFIDLLEDFSVLADEWRLYLDEHDKNDLIHVRAK